MLQLIYDEKLKKLTVKQKVRVIFPCNCTRIQWFTPYRNTDMALWRYLRSMLIQESRTSGLTRASKSNATNPQ